MSLAWARCFGISELTLEEVVGSTEYRVGDRFGSTVGAVQGIEYVNGGILWAGCIQDTMVTRSERLFALGASCCSREPGADKQLGDVDFDLTVHQTIASIAKRSTEGCAALLT